MHNICVDVKHSKPNGYLWHQKSNEAIDFRKKRLLHNGLILRVNPVTSTDSSKFVQAAFSRSCDQFAASDHLGKLYLFEIKANRYRLISRLPSQSLCITWNDYRTTKLLVSLNDCSLCYVDIVTKKIEKLAGHSAPASHIHIHSHGILGLSNSNHEAIIWDLQSCTQKQKLNINLEVQLIEALFSGFNTILTCFKDNSIFIWDIETCQCKIHLSPKRTVVGQYKTFATSKNGFELIAAGLSSELHTWNLKLGVISKIIQLPSNVKGTKKIYILENLTSNLIQVIALLSTDNLLNLIDIATATVIVQIAGYDSPLNKVAISSTYAFMVTILESGCLDLYDLNTLISGKDTEIVKITMPTLKEKRTSGIDVKSCPTRPKSQGVVFNEERMFAGMDQRSEIENEQPCVKLDFSKLYSLLDTYGEYPERYRNLIWKFLLQLPENTDSYFALEENGIHSFYYKLEEKFPLSNEKLMERLKSILSCLAFWSPLFGYVEYIPLFCFPFVKSINKNIQCFETIATILLNWCGSWFEFLPCPPVTILKSVQQLLIYHDEQLNQHFMKYQIEPQIYAWTILETSFSEIFNKNDWMRVWDHIISNHPSFIICICVAYSIVARRSLMSCLSSEDFGFFYHHQNPVSLKSVLTEAYRIQKETPKEIHPKYFLPDFEPLTKNTYPVFNKYPIYVVDYKLSKQDQYQKNEDEYQQLKKSTRKLDEKLQELDREEKICQQKLESFKEIGDRRKQFLIKEEEQFAIQRNKLLSLKRDMQLKELCVLKTLRNRFSKEQQLRWQLEIQELEYKIEAKMKQHEQEILKAMSEVKEFQTFLVMEKQNLELEVNKLLNQAAKGDNRINDFNQQVEASGMGEHEKQRDATIKSMQLINLQQKNLMLEQEIANLTQNLNDYKQAPSLEERPEREESLRAGGSADTLPKRNPLNDAFSVRQRLAYSMRTRYS